MTLTEEEAYVNSQPELEGTSMSLRGMQGQVGEVHDGPDTAVTTQNMANNSGQEEKEANVDLQPGTEETSMSRKGATREVEDPGPEPKVREEAPEQAKPFYEHPERTDARSG